MKGSIKKIFIDTVPVLISYFVFSFGFGIIMKSSGYGILLAISMPLAIHAGSMQYAAVGLFNSGASFVTIAVTTLMVNIRHIFYGISMIDKYKGMGAAKPYLIFALTDETYSLVCRDNLALTDSERKRYYILVSAFNHACCVIGTALGALFGSVVSFNSEGIGFALTALFVTIFLEQWLTAKKYIPATMGVVITLACLLIFGADKFLIPSMLIIALLLCLYKEKKKDKGEESVD